MENDYHNPYDHRPLGLVKSTNNSDSDQTANLYEAPSCLVRNPSGSLFIPSSTDPLGQTTIDSRLRYDTYSPHHHLRGSEKQNGSPSGRSPNGETYKHLDSHRGTLPNYASQMAGMTSGRHGSGITGTSGGAPGVYPLGVTPP